MNTKIWIMGLIVALTVLVGAGVAWLQPDSAHAASTSAQVAPVLAMTPNKRSGQNPMTPSTQHSEQRDAAQQAWLQQALTRYAQAASRGNIGTFLQAWQQQCGQQPAVCQQWLQQALAQFADQDFAQLMQHLLDRLPAYEQAMQQMVMSTTMSPEARFERIWQLREQMLGQQEAMLGFGQEYAYAHDQFAFGALLSQAGQQSTTDRLHAFEQFAQARSSTTGQIDGAVGTYEKALKVMLVGVSDPVQVAQITAQLRTRYLTPELTQALNARDQQVQAQQQTVHAYHTAVAALDAQMQPLKSSLSEAAWQAQYQAELTQIRLRYFAP